MIFRKIPAHKRPMPANEFSEGSLRCLPFDGAHNFRDLGGYNTSVGKMVKRGLIYRSGALRNLSKEDKRYLNLLGIRRVVDFRSGYEQEKHPDTLPDNIFYIHSPIGVAGEDVQAQMIDFMKGKNNIDLAVFMKDINYNLVITFSNVYREWLADIVKIESAVPQVFHCTAGKDRTGFAAAILLRILEVPEEVVIEDYLITNICNRRISSKLIKRMQLRSGFKRKAEDLRPLFAAEREYLLTAFKAIDDKYGSFSSYCSATDGLALSADDIEKLSSIFLVQ